MTAELRRDVMSAIQGSEFVEPTEDCTTIACHRCGSITDNDLSEALRSLHTGCSANGDELPGLKLAVNVADSKRIVDFTGCSVPPTVQVESSAAAAASKQWNYNITITSRRSAVLSKDKRVDRLLFSFFLSRCLRSMADVPPEWHSSLFDCCEDPRLFAVTFCCPCYAIGRNKARADGRAVTVCDVLCCPSEFHTRQQLRSAWQMSSSSSADCAAVVCCWCCAVAQDAREMDFRRRAVVTGYMIQKENKKAAKTKQPLSAPSSRSVVPLESTGANSYPSPSKGMEV